jgi:Protein of unknown function (DUF2585)
MGESTASMRPRTGYLLTALVVAAAGVTLYAMGRVPICPCGYVKLRHGVVQSSENSQHLSDWYTPSHVIHGFGFYALTWLIDRRFPFSTRLLLATTLEASWEVIENTPFVINRYRQATIALDYYGDSIINSLSDIGAMMVGFWLASRLPVAWTVTSTVAMELFVGFMIRDNWR